MATAKIPEYRSTTLVQHIVDTLITNSEIKYCFILGAGASKSSGISTGAELSKRWFDDIRRLFPDYLEWAAEHKIDETELAKHYGKIYKKRFEINPVEGYEFLQNEMSRSTPSFGYSVLAQLLDRQHNVVITTNFDSLVEDALFLYSENKPLICGHESLSEFVKPTTKRSIIIKVHRDILLNPKNEDGELLKLEKGFADSLDRIFQGYTPIVLGYGGNDLSLMSYLSGCNSIKNIFWCRRSNDVLSEEIKKLLEEKNGKIFEIAGFDELMFQIYAEIFKERALDKRVKDQAEKRASDWAKQLVDLSKSLTDAESKESLSLITKNRKYKDWWDVELAVNSTDNIDLKDKIYKEGISEFSDSAELHGNYAFFLKHALGNYDEAEKHYLKSLELAPSDVELNNNYGVFLKEIRADYDAAEKYYKSALQFRPDHYGVNVNYANLLSGPRKNYDEAEKYYKKAIELNVNEILPYTNYGVFLVDIRKDYKEAERIYKIGLGINPEDAYTNSNYAQCLIALGNMQDAQLCLDKVLHLPESKVQGGVLLEVNFYCYANFYNDYPDAAKELDALLATGAKSEGWDFGINIEKAKEQKHPNLAKVIEYAEKISGNKYH